jgi:hypothetical protein
MDPFIVVAISRAGDEWASEEKEELGFRGLGVSEWMSFHSENKGL